MDRKSPSPTPVPKSLRRNPLALRLLHAQEDERRRIARMLHDDLGQTLTAAVLELEYARTAPEGAQIIDATLTELRRLLGAARDLSLELRPALIDEEGLEAAFGALVSRLCGVREADAQFDCRLRREFPADIGLIAFRIVQDAANLLCPPSSRFALTVRTTAGALRMSIDASARPHGSSLGRDLSMTDRAAMIGGSVQLHLLRSGGTRVEVNLPIPALKARRSKRET